MPGSVYIFIGTLLPLFGAAGEIIDQVLTEVWSLVQRGAVKRSREVPLT